MGDYPFQEAEVLYYYPEATEKINRLSMGDYPVEDAEILYYYPQRREDQPGTKYPVEDVEILY